MMADVSLCPVQTDCGTGVAGIKAHVESFAMSDPTAHALQALFDAYTDFEWSGLCVYTRWSHQQFSTPVVFRYVRREDSSFGIATVDTIYE